MVESPSSGTAEAGQRPVVAWLGGGAVQHITTSCAHVFIAADRVLKMKRAIRLPFLDFSTLDLREAACRAELDLNRRTAPALYRRVVAITRDGDGFALDGAGEAVEWAVEMGRFDQDLLFDRLLARGALDRATVADLARRVATFHAQAPADRSGDGAQRVGEIIASNAATFAQHGVLPPDRVAALTRQSEAALARVAALLDARAAAGCVRHCHGDLHLRNIVLLDGVPTPFDALEFSPRMATIDMLYDLAFLLMDLVHRARHDLANAALNAWLEESGDEGGLAALPLLMSVRAAVRAHVEAGSGAPDRANAYLERALALLEAPPARLVAVGGLSGSGKSTLARGLAPDFGAAGAVLLRSDVIRKHLAGVAPTDRLPSSSYTPAGSAAVYAELTRRAAALLAQGQGVVADAVFARPEERAAIAALTPDFTGLWLQAPPETLRQRVTDRRDDASDATAAVVDRQLDYDIGPLDWTVLDSAGGAAAVLEAARKHLRRG